MRIRSGAPRTYYIGIESAMPAVPGMPAPLKALCVVPFGMEEGTEAAAVTTVGIRETSMPPSIRFDRPFVFVIRERLSGTILFMGKVAVPISES